MVLEYNCRLGDPDTRPLMIATGFDLASAFCSCNIQTTRQVHAAWKTGASVLLVLLRAALRKNQDRRKTCRSGCRAVVAASAVFSRRDKSARAIPGSEWRAACGRNALRQSRAAFAGFPCRKTRRLRAITDKNIRRKGNERLRAAWMQAVAEVCICFWRAARPTVRECDGGLRLSTIRLENCVKGRTGSSRHA